MDANQYQKDCLRTECDQSVSMRRYMTEMAIRLNHSVLGLTGEVGELATAVEKWLHYGRELDRANLIEEFGDCLWYLCLGMSAVGLKMEHVMEANLRKLKTRYPDRYTDERATQRDLEAEKKVMRTTEEVKLARRGPGGCCEKYANNQACNCLDLAFDSRRETDFTINQESNVGDHPRSNQRLEVGQWSSWGDGKGGPHPSHQWKEDKPQTRCVKCGAYRHLSSGFEPCPVPAVSDPDGLRSGEQHKLGGEGDRSSS